MKIFRSYTFTWQQVSIFKLTMALIGIIIGAFWHTFFGSYLTPLLVIAVIGSVYLLVAASKQW